MMNLHTPVCAGLLAASALLAVTVCPVRAEDPPGTPAPEFAPEPAPDPAPEAPPDSAPAPAPDTPPDSSAAPIPEPTSDTAAAAAPAPETAPDAAPDTAPAPESTPAPAPVAAIDDDYDPRIPQFQRRRPGTAFELIGTRRAFGDKELDARQAGAPARGITFKVQYQPTGIQSLGVFGIGPSFSLYPVAPRAHATQRFYSNWAVGGEAQYQARFFRNQPIVPVAGYAAEYMAYAFNSGSNGRLVSKGPFVGGYLLLNIFEPRAASDFFGNYGVVRSYLVAQIRQMQGSDANISFSERSYYFGLRIEK